MPPCVSPIAIQNRHPYGTVFCIDLGLLNIPFEAGLLPASQCLRKRLRCISPVEPVVIEQELVLPNVHHQHRLESRNIAHFV